MSQLKKMVITHLTFANEIYIDVQTHMDSRTMCVNIKIQKSIWILLTTKTTINLDTQGEGEIKNMAIENQDFEPNEIHIDEQFHMDDQFQMEI